MLHGQGAWSDTVLQLEPGKEKSNASLLKLAYCGTPLGQASITLLHPVGTTPLVRGLGVHGDYRRFSGVATTRRLVRLMYVLPQLAAQREIYVPNG